MTVRQYRAIIIARLSEIEEEVKEMMTAGQKKSVWHTDITFKSNKKQKYLFI